MVNSEENNKEAKNMRNLINSDGIYELGANGLEKVDTTQNNDLPLGTLIYWTGNYGWAPEKFCIVGWKESSFGVVYQCASLQDYHIHNVESYNIRTKENERPQCFLLLKETFEGEQYDRLLQKVTETSDAKKREEDAKQAETDRLIALGKERFKKYIPAEAQAVIVAKLEIDDSEPQTDYFSTHTGKTVILGWSKHQKDLFSEMRKYAHLIPETKHLGVGCGWFEPRVIVNEDAHYNGGTAWKGCGSPWHRELVEDENGQRIHFLTLKEAEQYITEKGTPEPINIDGKTITFSWKIEEEQIEHREKYSMGAGYYLKSPHGRGGWQIEKEQKYREDWGDSLYKAMGERCIFEEV